MTGGSICCFWDPAWAAPQVRGTRRRSTSEPDGRRNNVTTSTKKHLACWAVLSTCPLCLCRGAVVIPTSTLKVWDRPMTFVAAPPASSASENPGPHTSESLRPIRLRYCGTLQCTELSRRCQRCRSRTCPAPAPSPLWERMTSIGCSCSPCPCIQSCLTCTRAAVLGHKRLSDVQLEITAHLRKVTLTKLSWRFILCFILIPSHGDKTGVKVPCFRGPIQATEVRYSWCTTMTSSAAVCDRAISAPSVTRR